MLKAAAFALFAAFLGAGSAAAQTMTLTSPDIKPGGKIADEQAANVFGCTGGNISPALSWSGAPKDTKSFALSVYDPDAPTGSGFWHWVVFNIPADVTSLAKNARRSERSRGAARARCRAAPISALPGYGGPCPPKGDAGASLPFHHLRRGHAEARRRRKHQRRRGRLHAALPHARQGGAGRPLRALTGAPLPARRVFDFGSRVGSFPHCSDSDLKPTVPDAPPWAHPRPEAAPYGSRHVRGAGGAPC